MNMHSFDDFNDLEIDFRSNLHMVDEHVTPYIDYWMRMPFWGFVASIIFF